MASLRDREAWYHILKLYKGMPHLWDRNNLNYGNRSMMKEGYTILTSVYRQKLDKGAKVNDLKRKISNLRTTYFRELRKVKEYKERGEIYTPSLWYFEKMNFLDKSNVKEYDNDTVESSSTMDPNEMEIEIQMEEPAETKQNTKKNEYWDVIGKSIGYQMRDLNKKQYAIVLKIISDIIYLGRLDKLSEATHVDVGPSYTNSSPPRTIYTLTGSGTRAADVRISRDQNMTFKGEDDFDDED